MSATEPTVHTCAFCHGRGWNVSITTGYAEVCTYCMGKPRYVITKKLDRKPVR